MLFTSYEFILFAAALILVYYLIPARFQWMLLLAGSWIFYAVAGIGYLPYLLVTCITVYFTALQIERVHTRQKVYLKEHKAELSREERKTYQAQQKKVRSRLLVLCLILNIGILAVVKYANFFLSNVNALLSLTGSTAQLSFLSLAMPMGISFYTLQAIGYLLDVNRETVKAERNFFRFALFVSFFPQLVQGPISRFGDLSKTLYVPHRFDTDTICKGLQRVLWGYFKKMVIADRILTGVTEIIGSPGVYRGAYVFAGMLLYTLELYADFTGGIDITIGLAQTLGITVQENFEQPYFSRSLKEYWRRWHISMCSWFRDYIFYPLSISGAMRSLGKWVGKHFGKAASRRVPVYVSTFVVWFATGIWHGASWNFIIWGLANCAVLLISEELEPLYARFHGRFPTLAQNSLYRIFQTLRTFLLVCCLNLFDCYASIAETAGAFLSMFTVHNWGILTDGSLLNLGLSALDYGITAFGVIVMFLVSFLQVKEPGVSVRGRVAALPYAGRFVIWFGLFLLVLLLGAYGIGYDASQFIYNQF